MSVRVRFRDFFDFFFLGVVCFTDQDVATLTDVVMRLCVQRIFADAAVMSLCTGIDDVVCGCTGTDVVTCQCVCEQVLMLTCLCVNRH